MSATVAILMGSESDRDVMGKATAALDEFGVKSETRVISAHRKPRELVEYVESCGADVFICGAGMAAALPGVVAAHTTKPVIGVPIAPASGGGLGGLDPLLSIVQMPPNVPVATVAVNGARNAGLLAVQILAISDADLAGAFERFKQQLAQS